MHFTPFNQPNHEFESKKQIAEKNKQIIVQKTMVFFKKVSKTLIKTPISASAKDRKDRT